VNDNIAPTEDPLAKLERLRKRKRLAELRAQAGGEAAPAAQPESFAANRTIVDDEEEIDIDALLDEVVAQIPGGYNAWKNGYEQKIGADGRRVVPGVGKETAPADSNFYNKSDAEMPVMARKPPPPSPPKPKPPPPRQTTDWHFGDPSKMSDEALAKRNNANGDAAGRIIPRAANALIGGVDLLSEPGRWADDAIGAVAPWWPSLVWDDQGFRLETAGSMSEQEKGYGGVGRIPMSEAKNDSEGFADMVGDGIGFLGPGKIVNNAAQKTGQVVSKLPGVSSVIAATTAKGSNASARGSRYGRRMLSTLPEAGVQAAVFGASTAAPAIIDDGYIVPGEDPVARAAEFATNPLSYVAPAALSAVYRGSIGIKSGGKTVTPQAVQRQNLPNMMTATDKAVAALGDLPIPSGIAPKDADRALGILYRSMSAGGVPDDVMQAAVKKYNELPGDRPAPAVFLRQELSMYDKAVQNLDDALYEIGQKAPEVGEALKVMRTTQAQRLQDGLTETLGKGNRTARNKKLGRKLEKLGDEHYAPILARGAVDDEAATNLRVLLNDTEFQKEIPADYRAKLSLGAIDRNPEVAPSSGPPARPGETGPGRGSGPDMMGGNPLRGQIALQQRIEENPLEVAHKLYSSLTTRIREARGGDVGKLKQIRAAIKADLFKAGGGEYKKANADYFKTAQAQRALSRPDKLFAESLKSHQIDKVKADYKAMTPAEKESYKISLKGLLNDELKRANANNDFVVLGRMKREGTLDAIEEILNVGSSTKGSDVVRNIRNVLDEQDTIAGVDPSVKTNRGDRLASGREAYAGKTGALEHTGRYDLNALGQDIALSAGANLVIPGSSAIVPIRAIYRGAQKLLARGAAGPRSGRAAAGRIALERPNMPGRVNPAAAAARQKRVDAARAMYRKNGKFGGKAEYLDPDAPGPPPTGGASGFDDEGFARSMQDDGPMLPDDGSGGAAMTIIDEGYQAPPPPRQKKLPPEKKQKQLPSGQKLIAGDRTAKQKEDDPEVPKSAAERYVDELRARKKQLEDRLDEQAREKDMERGRLRESERVANDAERLRMREEALKTQSASEGLRIERLREQELAAVERARRAAEWADNSDAQGPPEVKDGPFQKLGRIEDRWRAPAGDPRSLRDAMKYLVGEGERAAVSNNLRRFGRDTEIEWYNAPEINRANELLRAAQGQKEGISPEVLDIVGKMNGANRKWLAEQLEDPKKFDLIDLMQKIDELPARGPKELQRAAEGPIAAIGGGIGAAVLGGKALYDAREKRTPEQIEADRKRIYGQDTGDELFNMPVESEVRQMQAALNALGITDRYGGKLVVDGGMGDRFREAVADFASRNGLQTHPLNPGGLSKKIVEKLQEYYQ
jgi:hypothetical protein